MGSELVWTPVDILNSSKPEPLIPCWISWSALHQNLNPMVMLSLHTMYAVCNCLSTSFLWISRVSFFNWYRNSRQVSRLFLEICQNGFLISLWPPPTVHGDVNLLWRVFSNTTLYCCYLIWKNCTQHATIEQRYAFHIIEPLDSRANHQWCAFAGQAPPYQDLAQRFCVLFVLLLFYHDCQTLFMCFAVIGPCFNFGIVWLTQDFQCLT